MKRKLILIALLMVAAAGAWRLFVAYDNRFPFGRMWETPVVRPHEEAVVHMAPGRVPWDGGEAEYRYVAGEALVSPILSDDPNVLKEGSKLYGYFCLQCHGEYFDGNRTVGQSFSPLPGDLMSPKVQSLPDGAIFKEISYGKPGGRQPALATTMSITDRWKITVYIKSLGVR